MTAAVSSRPAVRTTVLCTLFNRRYLPQGLALYRSLERTAGDGFVLHILCMDEITFDALAQLRLPRARLIRLAEFEDDALRAVKPHRSVGEYCWTCTAPLLLYVQNQYPPGTVVSYVDADIRFFADPAVGLAELGDGSILVHEHDFAEPHAHFREVAGRFNVGVVAVRNDEEGRACLERWRGQCLAECVMQPELGKCGDQNYLDEWPDLYGGLVISANPGYGLGPWNVEKHRLDESGGRLHADGVPVVFYHYHSLRLWRPRFGLRCAMMASSYHIGEELDRLVYRPYVAELWRALNQLDRTARMEVRWSLPMVRLHELLDARRHKQLSLAFGF